ncbi:shikimate kinase [Dethiosulfatibacter aminovorans DSM 17477]|uniref:Shikimate kinase n=1 Tax=Dethiosulfatibacter aminovorans DSM 17477 TaxID=1121476 RepID=A0A1M6AJH6_9FIRM|nr:shikimate kinase [Dethiosulfatibacter aminovorans]SHI36581.1 shikimate kinase [Dethiosulfatibacter aminovorans DSM 17477]
MKNIALIGMMGSGKTTLAEMLAEKMKLDYCCADEYLEEKYNRSIPDIFEKDGEDGFRKLESEAIRDLAKRRNIIIATGGGVILREENIDTLRENGFIIIFLNRSIESILKDITTENRPLIKEDKNRLLKIYSEREHLYKEYSDIIINNHDCLDETLDKLYNSVALLSNDKSDKK